MRLLGEQMLLRVYLRNTDKYGWHSASEALAEKALTNGLAGATVLRGFRGLDICGNALSSSRWAFVEHVPVVVQFLDEPQSIRRFLSLVEEIVAEGLLTLNRVPVLLYRQVDSSGVEAKRHLETPDPSTPFHSVPLPHELPDTMPGEAGQVIRVCLRRSDLLDEVPLYDAMIHRAQDMGISTVVAFRSPMGFGADGIIHTAKIGGSSQDLPIVLEFVDSGARIQTFLPFLEKAVDNELVTCEDVWVMRRVSEAKGQSR